MRGGKERAEYAYFSIVKMAHKLNKRAARQSAPPMFANWACGDFLRLSMTLLRGGGAREQPVAWQLRQQADGDGDGDNNF